VAHGTERGPSDSHDGGGLRLAIVLDGNGGARELGWEGLSSWKPEQGPLWVDLDPRAARAIAWLDSESGLPERERKALLGSEPRPQVEASLDGAYLISLSGLAPGVEESSGDLARLRVRVHRHLVVSLCDRELPGVAMARESFRAGTGARDVPELTVALGAWLSGLLRDAALDFENTTAELEFAAHKAQGSEWPELGWLQISIARLRRHVAPHKVLVARLLAMPESWLIRSRLTEWQRLADELLSTDNLLQNLQERANALHDYVGQRLVRRMNYILYVLTILTSVMLPLTFLTSLFGMNIGIKGGSYRFMDGTAAFLLVCVTLAVIALVEYRFVRRRHLM
jgi:zinc transporter